MMIEVDRTGTVEGLHQAMHRVMAVPGIQVMLVLSCSANEFTPDVVDDALKAVPIPLLGGVFPVLIYNRERLERGSIVWGVKRRAEISVVRNISDPTVDIDLALESALPEIPQQNALQVVLVDGFSKRLGALISALHEQVGLIDTIGGGAGSLDFVQRPCLFTNEGMVGDAAVIATIATAVGVGVSHGWSEVEGPFRVTESHQNTIVSLDWRPAFEVYREVVERHSGQLFTDENFFDLAKAYPFGINRLDAEHVVRDPLMLDDNNGLVCVGEVPESEHVDILHGNIASLTQAASQARARADARLSGEVELRVFMDCISRVLFLGDDFEREIAAVQSGAPLLGACTIGEIANHGGDFLEFYNKTAVVAALPAPDVMD